MRLIVVRHGQTRCNIDRIWHGWDECALTEEGLAQAEAVGRRLAEERITAIYTSPSRRARQTAEALARPHRLVPVVEPGLRERNAGLYEGATIEKILAERPTIWEERDADLWNWRPPEGESFREVLDRTVEVVDRLRRQHQGETIALATHMSPTRMLISRLAGIPIEETYQMEFPSTGISIFSFEGDNVRVEALNDASHIG